MRCNLFSSLLDQRLQMQASDVVDGTVKYTE